MMVALVPIVVFAAGVGSHAPVPQDTLLRVAEDRAVSLVCAGRETCPREGQIRADVRTVVSSCLEIERVPRYMCLALAANFAAESGARVHPTCGGLNQSCAVSCDALESRGARHDCYLQCALDQGIVRGSARWKRVDRCNDRGSSRGPFQMKPGRIKQCKRLLGDETFSPFDLRKAAQCTMLLIRRTAESKRWPCGNVGNRWMVAMRRVGKGVRRLVSKAQPAREVPLLRGGFKSVPAQAAVYEPICGPSRYAEWGLAWWRRALRRGTL